MKKSLYIVDGHAQIYAAYYAPMGGQLSSPSGEPTKATLIFTTMMQKLVRQRRPDYLVVTMDAKGPTFRHEMYADYKATRPPMPEDLPKQIERIEQILTAMGVVIVRKEGYEADDLIGTLAKRGRAEGLDVYICSKDKDLEQLLTDGVVMYDVKKGEEHGVQWLAQEKGIAPGQVPDVLALQGDTSDNIPGVPDVGPKTALQWIQKYGSVAGVIEHQDEIKGKRGENLRAGLEQLKLSLELTKINCEVPLEELDWEALAIGGADEKALAQLYTELGFKKLLTQLDEEVVAAAAEAGGNEALPAAPKEVKYVLVDNEQLLEQLAQVLAKQKIFALDTETTGLNPVAAELVGLSFSWQAGLGYYLPIKGPMGAKCLDWELVRERLGGMLTDAKVHKVGQNIKYDMIVLERAGVKLAGVVFDTMVASYVLDSSRARHSMDSMAEDYLGYETIKIEALIGKGKNQLTFDMVDLGIATEYAAEDADITWRLYEYLNKRMTDDDLRRLFEQVEMPLVEVLAQMELNGVALDVPWLRKMSGQFSDRMGELLEDIYKQSGCEFNVDSPKQLAEVLFDKLGLKSTKRTSGGKSGAKSRSTDQEVLEALQWEHPVPGMVLEYRKLAKLKNTYVDKLPTMICSDTKRVHASFNQTVTATGRLSSSNPNMQNIPIRSDKGQEIRRAFVPGQEGYVILAADYSQVELRFMAHLSGDEALIKAFKSGQDIHRYVAAQVYGKNPEDVTSDERAKAKGVNFGIMYGQTAYGLSRAIGVPVEEAQQFIDEYFGRYKDVQGFVERVIERAKKEGAVRTILGRRRPIQDLNSKNYNIRRLAERMAVNTVVQGSAADLIKLAMLALHKRIAKEQLEMRMLLQVHDELVFELPREKVDEYSEIVRQEMSRAMELKVPITVDVGWGENWLECK
ncbi:MAG: DNA polymerase I [Sedimentisphaerales bacterium]|nr:DNA polymerase I [Sedimentisphaerales bacterium]